MGLGGSIAADNQFSTWSPMLITSLSVYSEAVKSPALGTCQELFTRLACEGGRVTGDG